MKQQLQDDTIAADTACGYDAAMARKLAKIVAECSKDDGILDFDDLTGNSDSTHKALPLDLMMRPDLGIEFVRRVGDRKSLSILCDPRLRWLKVAASMKGSALPNNWKQPSEAECDAVALAFALASDPDSAAHAELVNACLLCGSATLGDVAEVFKMEADHLAAYHDLFFNVLSRRGERAYIQLIAHPGKGTCLPVGMDAQDSARPWLALAVRCENLAMLFEYLGWENAADTSSNLREASSRALLMLINRIPAFMHSMPGDGKTAQKLAFAALHAARSVLGQDKNDLQGFGGGDDDFSKFAESLLKEDVEELQNQIQRQMNHNTQVHEQGQP